MRFQRIKTVFVRIPTLSLRALGVGMPTLAGPSRAAIPVLTRTTAGSTSSRRPGAEYG